MDIKILHSWLKKYLQTNAPAPKIGEYLALCGPSVEKVTKYGKNDWLYEIEVTTNRVDMMSVYGIAREAAAILPSFGFEAKLKSIQLIKPGKKIKKPLPLTIDPDVKLGHRVMAVVMDNVKLGNSPKWLKKTLEANDIRSLNNVIDITNYVMMEVGHPCHVFDYDRVKGSLLKFRLSQKDEEVTTLDKKTYQLPGDDIVIEDIDGTIVDLPGIMGTANSVVTDNTKRIILFIDNNDAKKMRATSMTTGIRTVAVTLNEKSVDPALGEVAIKRGMQLYQSICGARQASALYDWYPQPATQPTISITQDFIDDKIGVKVKKSFVKKTLQTLGFEVKSEADKYEVKVPTWRIHDVTIPIDLVEEIARIYGYHNLPSILPEGELPPTNPQSTQFKLEYNTKVALKHLGFTENYNYSLISDTLINQIGDKNEKYLKLKNPLTNDWLYMRRDIYPSLLESLAKNQSRVGDINFFELSNVYHQQDNDLPRECIVLSLVKNNGDFYDLKGVIEYLASQMNVELEFKVTPEKSKHPNLNSTIQADIFVGKNKVGFVGQLSSKTQKEFGIEKDVYLAQLNFEVLSTNAGTGATYQEISKYPAIIENLTFFNDSQTPAVDMIKAGNKVSNLVNIKIVDFFENKINLEVSYQSSTKNLTDTDITPIRKKLVTAIEKLGPKLQGKI